MASGRLLASAPSDGSRTLTTHDVQPRSQDDLSDSPTSTQPQSVGALRLRGGPRRIRRRVAWDEDVVDNEGAGKKKSKICCIYHKPKRFDESSDEDSSDSDSESDCSHGHDHSRAHAQRSAGERVERSRSGSEIREVVHKLEDESEPNAYEVGPGSKKGKKKDPGPE